MAAMWKSTRKPLAVLPRLPVSRLSAAYAVRRGEPHDRQAATPHFALGCKAARMQQKACAKSSTVQYAELVSRSAAPARRDERFKANDCGDRRSLEFSRAATLISSMGKEIFE